MKNVKVKHVLLGVLGIFILMLIVSKKFRDDVKALLQDLLFGSLGLDLFGRDDDSSSVGYQVDEGQDDDINNPGSGYMDVNGDPDVPCDPNVVAYQVAFDNGTSGYFDNCGFYHEN